MIKLAHMRITSSNSRPGLLSIRPAASDGTNLQMTITEAGFAPNDMVCIVSIHDLRRMLTLFDGAYGKTVAQRDLIEELREALNTLVKPL